jgi:periplasmic protein TonB
MKPEMILQADVLDIIFDNRNKEYGAYELRSHYERRLKKSLLIVFLILFSLIASSLIKNYFFPNAGTRVTEVNIPDTELTQVDNVKPDVKPKEIIHQNRRIAEANLSKPIIIRQEIKTTMATQDDVANKIISNKNINGDELRPDETVQMNGNAKGAGLETQPQPASEEAVVVDHPDFMPEFPGGESALQRFLSKNLRMPREDLEPGSKVSTLVRFVVDKNGIVTGIEFEKSGGKDFDNEVARVVKKMPQWKPGRQNGKNVAVYFKLPVIFQVPDEN